MYYITLDKESKTAYYVQLMNSIISAIDTGILRDRDKLPTEDEIIECLNVSRFVVRQAYENLLKAGYIVSTRGKGSFVAQRKPLKLHFNRLFSLKQVLSENHVRVTDRLILREVLSEDNPMERELRLKPDERCFHVIHVLCDANNNPYIYQEYFFPLNLYPGLETAFTLDRPVLDILEKDYHLEAVEIRNLFLAQNASPRLALLLNLDPEAPVIGFDSIVLGPDQKPLMVQRSYFDAAKAGLESEIRNA